MCRFVLYLGPSLRLASLITEPENSIIHQSVDSRERPEPMNGDGFGVAWYVPESGPTPALFRSITPAWSNRNLRSVAEHTSSPCVLAHVRAASPGFPVAEPNTHPFVWRHLAFAHNGLIGGFPRLKRALLGTLSEEAYAAVEGTTDSEHFFALLVDHILGHGTDRHAVEVLAEAFVVAVARVETLAAEFGITERTSINAVLTDGHCAVAVRYTDSADPERAESLHIHSGSHYVVEEGLATMRHRETESPSAVIASEPLTGDGGWMRVPGNTLVVVTPDRAMEFRPLTSARLGVG